MEVADIVEIEDFRPPAVEMENVTREQVMELVRAKDALEAEMKELGAVLEGQGVGMEDALVDAEGFPRGDIDVYQVRHARSQIRTKGTDLKELMKRIEAGLHNLHAQAREAGGGQVPRPPPATPLPPFARILVVVPGGPADTAGLKQGDLVAKFGSVAKTNFKNLKNISDVAEACKDSRMEVVVVRGDGVVRCRLTPTTGWGGQGLLGFKIRPLTDSVTAALLLHSLSECSQDR